MSETARTIGPYSVVAELGRGGMGTVYDVTDPALPGRRLAPKLNHLDGAAPDPLERFVRAASLRKNALLLRIFVIRLPPKWSRRMKTW